MTRSQDPYSILNPFLIADEGSTQGRVRSGSSTVFTCTAAAGNIVGIASAAGRRTRKGQTTTSTSQIMEDLTPIIRVVQESKTSWMGHLVCTFLVLLTSILVLTRHRSLPVLKEDFWSLLRWATEPIRKRLISWIPDIVMTNAETLGLDIWEKAEINADVGSGGALGVATTPGVRLHTGVLPTTDAATCADPVVRRDATNFCECDVQTERGPGPTCEDQYQLMLFEAYKAPNFHESEPAAYREYEVCMNRWMRAEDLERMNAIEYFVSLCMFSLDAGGRRNFDTRMAPQGWAPEASQSMLPMALEFLCVSAHTVHGRVTEPRISRATTYGRGRSGAALCGRDTHCAINRAVKLRTVSIESYTDASVSSDTATSGVVTAPRVGPHTVVAASGVSGGTGTGAGSSGILRALNVEASHAARTAVSVVEAPSVSVAEELRRLFVEQFGFLIWYHQVQEVHDFGALAENRDAYVFLYVGMIGHRYHRTPRCDGFTMTQSRHCQFWKDPTHSNEDACLLQYTVGKRSVNRGSHVFALHHGPCGHSYKG